MVEYLAYSMPKPQPVFIEEVPAPIIRSIGKIIHGRSNKDHLNLDHQLTLLENQTQDESPDQTVVSRARSGESELRTFISSLTKAKTAHIEVFNALHANLVITTDINEDFLPEGTDIEIIGSLYGHLINTISHGVNTRIQHVKAAQLLRKKIPGIIEEITNSANQISNTLEDFSAADGMRLVTEEFDNVLNVKVQLYTD